MNNLISIELCKYGKSMGTRELAKKIREEVFSAIREKKKVIFNFANVGIISSAFADELFGKLYSELGENAFKDKIKVNRFDDDNVKKIILLIINKSINFRKSSPNTT